MKDMKQILCIIAVVLLVTALSFAAVADENEIIDYMQFDGEITVPDKVTDIEYGEEGDDPAPVSPPPSVQPIDPTTVPLESTSQASAFLRQGSLMDAVLVLRRLVGLA